MSGLLGACGTKMWILSMLISATEHEVLQHLHFFFAPEITFDLTCAALRPVQLLARVENAGTIVTLLLRQIWTHETRRFEHETCLDSFRLLSHTTPLKSSLVFRDPRCRKVATRKIFGFITLTLFSRVFSCFLVSSFC